MTRLASPTFVITLATMTAPALPLSTSRQSVLAATVITWLVTAAWDFLCASTLSIVAYHSTFSRLWQGVASAALGPSALSMGTRGVAAGLMLHLLVALTWSTVFILALAGSSSLRRALARPWGAFAVAAIYGPLIWLVMSLVVIPLATGKPTTLGFRWWVQVVAHVPFVTLPLVFTARRMLGLAGRAPRVSAALTIALVASTLTIAPSRTAAAQNLPSGRFAGRLGFER